MTAALTQGKNSDTFSILFGLASSNGIIWKLSIKLDSLLNVEPCKTNNFEFLCIDHYSNQEIKQTCFSFLGMVHRNNLPKKIRKQIC